ncbi:cytochrome c oxidase subunit II [Cerasicoccus arenae]|uniref:cytochrome-c oxidase n=1 Tax=Cerasicoccus arenae TaxID=424488 RepID=A0A8J3DKR3_9BACT|nr:cytochrome c oxidase subunit II [Cerasicoccus arenae]MBK1857658.1 cytochrome c oxidase subunit II [Cerasicoccus arenae]GHC12888.1 cytochrome c oxidase subunit 2 [Cerasicoccus arenae]
MTTSPRFRRFLQRAGFLALSLGLAGCSFTTPQSSLDPKGPVAREQLDLFYLTVWVCLGIFILVGGALVWVVIRFRERPGDDAKPMPSQGHGNPMIEIGLIGGSIFLLVIIAIPTLRAIWFTQGLPEDKPYYEESKLGTYIKGELAPEEKDNVLEINVYGWQWWFAFEYPQLGFTTANEFVMPVGKVVKFNLKGRDVIHSFWLPKLGGKVDIIPGRKNWLWLMADEEGYYFGQCAEYCGAAHAYMLFRAEVVSEDKFNEWVADYKQGAAAPSGFTAKPTAENPHPTNQDNWTAWAKQNAQDPQSLPQDDATKGAQVFMGKGKCIVCHTIDSSPAGGTIGPNLTKLGQRKSVAAGILNHYTEDGGLDEAKQAENLLNWVAYSHRYKPDNIMYYQMGAGLADLQYQGLTYADLSKVGITDKQLTSAGVSDEQLAELKANAGDPLTSIVSDQMTLRRIIKPLEDNDEKLAELAKVSGWLSPEEFKQVAVYLQSLK